MNRIPIAVGHLATVATIILLPSLILASPAEVSGWVPSTATFDQQAIADLDQAVDSGLYKDINSVVVIRDGNLLIERYYNGASRDKTHNPRSVGKTFASAVLGIAIEEGYIKSLDQPLGDFYDLQAFDNYSEKKAAVTLRHLITMTSGFDGYDFEADSPGNEENMYPQDNWVEWTLNLPMAADRAPGDEWRYFTAGIVVLGDILNQVLPGGLEAYAHDKLFGEMGITNYEWQHTPQHVVNTAGGIKLTPLDFAKFGELYRNGGTWQNTQVIPARWVEESVQPAIETTVPGNRYGYLWWHQSYDVDSQRLSAAYCTGNGGNKIFVFADLNLVVVVTASAYGKKYMHSQVDEMMTQFILPSIIR